MNRDHLPLADESESLSRAIAAALVGVCTVVLVGLMLLFATQGGAVISKVAHQWEQAQ